MYFQHCIVFFDVCLHIWVCLRYGSVSQPLFRFAALLVIITDTVWFISYKDQESIINTSSRHPGWESLFYGNQYKYFQCNEENANVNVMWQRALKRINRMNRTKTRQIRTFISAIYLIILPFRSITLGPFK